MIFNVLLKPKRKCNQSLNNIWVSSESFESDRFIFGVSTCVLVVLDWNLKTGLFDFKTGLLDLGVSAWDAKALVLGVSGWDLEQEKC